MCMEMCAGGVYESVRNMVRVKVKLCILLRRWKAGVVNDRNRHCIIFGQSLKPRVLPFGEPFFLSSIPELSSIETSIFLLLEQ